MFHDDWMSCTSASAKLWERAWRLHGRCEKEWEWRLSYSSWMNWQHTQQLTFWTIVRLCDKAGRLRVSSWSYSRYVHCRASGACLAWPLIYIGMVPLLAHGLTVKLSPCPCSHSSLVGRIAACLYGHSKCNLLLAQGCPRMIQHFTSTQKQNSSKKKGRPGNTYHVKWTWGCHTHTHQLIWIWFPVPQLTYCSFHTKYIKWF